MQSSTRTTQIASRVCARCRVQSRALATPHILPRAATPTVTSRSISAPPLQTSPPQRRAYSSRQTIPPKTHYDLFPQTLSSGPPPTGPFPINTRTLRREFLHLQSKTHPDLVPSSLKSKAEAASATLNEAYRTLLNPLLRAQYLLSLRGVDVANDETLKIEEPDLLMLVLEAREEIEEAQNEEDLVEPKRVNDERIRVGEEALDKAFTEDDVEAAKKEAVRMRYWVNIKDSLDAWEYGKPVVLQH